jgi:hypothetical protein
MSSGVLFDFPPSEILQKIRSGEGGFSRRPVDSIEGAFTVLSVKFVSLGK